MQRNILEYLENCATQYPDKIAFSDGTDSLTFAALQQGAKAVASALGPGHQGRPVAVFMHRHPNTICAFLGVLYAGGIYLPLDEEMGKHRTRQILKAAPPGALLCDAETQPLLEGYGYTDESILFKDAVQTPVQEDALAGIRQKAVSADAAYIVYTSGSTGAPKGVVATHANVIDYIEALSHITGAGEASVFGMQAPLYVDAFLKDIFLTLKHGATAYVIPKRLFMFPLKLVEYLNAHHINTLCWVVSALAMVSAMGALQKDVPRHVHTVVFGGEVFAPKQLALWQAALPGAKFINMYGPTECTGFSCYYSLPPSFVAEGPIPIGGPMPGTGVFLLGEDGQPVTQPGQEGEVYIRGGGVTPGYYNDAAHTAEVFVQNPLQNKFTERVYKTGDLACYNKKGELVYLARKDHQIKHMGYRIELPEIEMAATGAPGVEQSCCVFDEARSKIVLFYMGQPPQKDVIMHLRDVLPRYMVPAAAVQMQRLPQTANGKIDRGLLRQQAETL